MSFLKVARTSEVKEHEVLAVMTRGGSVALTRVNGEICAFQNICTHDDNPLDDGAMEGEEIVCSRHGARFNVRTGKVCRMPATEDIEIYPVQIAGDDVLVSIE